MPRRSGGPLGAAKDVLHRHAHGKAKVLPRTLDVGVDCHDYRPVPLNWAIAEALARE